MKVLVVNTGSSSLKYQLIDSSNERMLAKGLCERIGLINGIHSYTNSENKSFVNECVIRDHAYAFKIMLEALISNEYGVLKDISEINAVGHRVVHGGEKFNKPVLIDDSVIKIMEDCIDLAPLHNPAGISGIRVCQEILKDVPMVAVFDTAFHQTIPDYAYMYALPYEMYEKYGVRKYGFHGTNHRYVSRRAAEIMQKPLEKIKIVSCHLGSGASICAIDKGMSIDTSMGFTPLAGLAMGTRSGTIDPSIISYIMDKKHMSVEEVNDYLNKNSGILGVSGISSDFRDLIKAKDEGHKRAQLALNIFAYRVKKYICEYVGVMGGIDALIFTAGVGENNAYIREAITNNLDIFGIKMDKKKNNAAKGEADVSKDRSNVRILIIPANEELEIARQCKSLLEAVN
ncbi:MAG: acetate kinase [Clostridia bacterium]|jgi:acetate kinase|nr:acetate kinase [Clostridia bacterium]MDD3092886.1 acetate kinase [Clostridia bacterium]MDD3971133.1 acetate kinase [Clostridia bacterium]MDD4542307.1 acetate kinase [Clostridia bacterium]